MTFWERSGKTIIIVVLSLLVAVITFGLLGSTGTFKNSVYDLGGAIVGFLATAALLNKIYGSDPSEIPKHELKGRPFASEETVKILDMRNQRPVPQEGAEKAPRNRVVLIDHYKLRKLSDDAEVVFKYATLGYGMEGSCVSQYLTQKWVDTTDESTQLGDDKHLKKRYEIRLNVQDVAKEAIIYIHNAVTYISAFDGKEKEWFHSHINFPTKSLTIILLFPEEQRCQGIKGFEEVGKSERREVDDKEKGTPIIVDDGKLVYWRIPNPLFGAEYQLEWEWQNTSASAQATAG